MANTEELIDMINEDSLTEAKQHLGKIRALVEAPALPCGGMAIKCNNCGASQGSSDVVLWLEIEEPRWSNCAACVLR